jgi:hypothetical protein
MYTRRVTPFATLTSRSSLAAVLLAATLLACGPKKVVCRVPEPAPPAAGSVEVTFLGVGGVLARWQGAAVMTAPLYSNPTVLEVAMSEIHPDRQRIDALLPRDVSDVRAILSGHSHYDHLMDVPYVALHKAKGADIVGNDALTKLLAPIAGDLGARTPANRLVSLEHEDPCGPGHQVAGTQFRIRAIPSEHSPQAGRRLLGGLAHLPSITLWRGEPEHALQHLPRRAGDWPAGRTLAYVIDLLEPGTGAIAFRIYYQDSPTRRPFGYPPRCVLDERAVDLAVLTLGGATELPDFPRDIVGEMQPRYVIGVHWEDFFTPRQLPLPGGPSRREEYLLAPGVNRSRFLAHVRRALSPGGEAFLPCPGDVTVFVRDGTTWRIRSRGTGSSS